MILAYILNDLFSLFGATFNYLFIIYIAQIYEIFSCSIFFTFKFKKRKFFIVRLIIYIICLITLAFSLGSLRSLNNATYLRIIYTLLLYIINMVLLTLLYDEPILTFSTAFIRILATRETVDVLFTLVLVLCGMDNRQSIDIISNSPYLNAFIYDLLHFLFQLLFVLFFNKKIEPGNQIRQILRQYSILGIAMLFFMVIIKTYIYAYEPESYALYVLSMILTGLLSIGVLLVQRYILKEDHYKEEIKEMNRVMYLEKKQYEMVRENIDIINMKCHDIKHQLESFHNKLTNEDINLLKTAVSIYDKTIRTGNKNLDTILYEKQLLCDTYNIKLTCLADGEKLAFMNDVHVYSLLNNILSNSIESVKEIIDKACDETVDFSNFMDEESGRIALLSDLDDTSAVFNKDSLEGSRKENFERLKETFPNYKDEQIFIFLNLIEERHMKINTFLAFHENFQHFKQELIALSQLSNEAPSEVIDSSAQDTPETKELKAFINLVKSYEEALQDPNKRGSQAGREDINKITSFIAYELGVEKAISPKGLDFLDKTLHILSAFNDPEVDPYGEDHKRNFYFTSQQRSFVTGLENTLGFLTPYVIEAENKSLDPKVKADFTKLCESFVLEKISEFTSLDDYARFDVNAFLNERMDSALASVQNPSQRKENTSPQTQGRV